MSYALPPGRPALMGVLNVTPDSFSDGGRLGGVDAAVAAGRRMVAEGADLVDVGGESTRPGADPVPEAEELRRVLPVVEALVAAGVAVSIDTVKPAVARAALSAGARVLNDVTGLRDPAMRRVAADLDATVCLMHSRGTPKTMSSLAVYDRGVVEEVRAELESAVAGAIADGVPRERLWLDPGIGFAKTTDHNLDLLRHLGRLVELGYPVLVGASRKAFIGRLLGSEDAPAPLEDRLEGTLAAHAIALAHGARIIRAHDVAAHARMLPIAASLRLS